MSETVIREPWEEIEAILENKDAEGLKDLIDSHQPSEVARALSRLDDDDQQSVLTLLDPEDAADVIEALSDAQGVDLLEDLPASDAAAIVDEMESDHRVDILGDLDEGVAEAILKEMDPEEAREARDLLKYPEDTAGGVMITEFLAYPQHTLVRDVFSDLRTNAERYSDYGVQYVYVSSEKGTLVGVVRLRDLVLAPNDVPLTSVMIVNPIHVFCDAPLDELFEFYDRYSFSGVPVTDHDGKMVGLALRADVEEAHLEQAEEAFMRFSGIVAGEELRSMPLKERSTRRLSWLCLNMLLSGVAVSVILGYQDVIQSTFVLVVFIPVVCNMSGCSGNQAVAVSIRELSLGLIKPRDYLLVLVKELGVGLVNGIVLGLLLGAAAFSVAYFYSDTDPLRFGMVLGMAFCLNTLLAVSLGGLIPLLLRALKVDPALGAPPMLTTLTDMCGFLLVLNFANWVL